MATLHARRTTLRSRQIAAIAIATIVTMLLVACDKSPATATTDTPAARAVNPYPKLTAAEIRFGVSPTRNKDVTYQPDVIIMEHGAEAIRSFSTNGMTWTFDANAPHAAEIQPDRILFATGRAVGRVLAVERNGNDLDVTLGPVELTDLIEEVHISYHGALDPATMISYYAPDYPRTSIDFNAPTRTSMFQPNDEPFELVVFKASGERAPVHSIQASADSSLRKALWTDSDPAQFRVLQMGSTSAPGGAGKIGPIDDIGIGDFHFVPNCCGGLGVSKTYHKDGLDFTATARLVLHNPSFDFHLDIKHGLKTAQIELTGVGRSRANPRASMR